MPIGMEIILKLAPTKINTPYEGTLPNFLSGGHIFTRLIMKSSQGRVVLLQDSTMGAEENQPGGLC